MMQGWRGAIVWLALIVGLTWVIAHVLDAQTQPKPEAAKATESPAKAPEVLALPLDKHAEREEILRLMLRATNLRAQIADIREQMEREVKAAEQRAQDAGRDYLQRLDALRKQYSIDPRCTLDADLKWILPGREGALPMACPAQKK